MRTAEKQCPRLVTPVALILWLAISSLQLVFVTLPNGNASARSSIHGQIAQSIVAAGATITAEGYFPNNQAIEPGELVTVSFCLQNVGDADAPVVASLLETGGVSSPSGAQDYGVLAAGGAAVCRSFTFTADSALQCGATLTATLLVGDSSVPFSFKLGVLSAAFCRMPTSAIPDNNQFGVNDILNIAAPISISRLTVSLDITHPWVGDLTVKLTHLDTGTTVTLIDRPGIPASPFGCSGNNIDVTLDDHANGPGVENACSPTPPAISGTLRPQSPLSTFSGQTLQGRWKLTVIDASTADTGTLNKWCIQENDNGYSCSSNSPCTLSCTQTTVVGSDPDRPGAIVNYNAGGSCGPCATGSCGTVICTPPPNTFFPIGTTTVSCSASAGPTCSISVIVLDRCPYYLYRSNDPGECGAVVNYPYGSTLTNCDPASGSFFPIGTTTVNCLSFETRSCSFPVEVSDKERPKFSPGLCGNKFVVTLKPRESHAGFPYPIVATDNCPGVTMNCVPPLGTLFSVGVHTIDCTAIDAANLSSNCEVTFAVRTPIIAARAVTMVIAGLVKHSVLRPGEGNSLVAKLHAAIDQMERENFRAASTQLDAFNNEVNALIRSGRLPVSEGQRLIDSSNQIIVAITPGEPR